MGNEKLHFNAPIGIFNEGDDVRLDIGLESATSLTDASENKPTTRLVIRKLSDPEWSGELTETDVVGIFSEDNQLRLDIGEACFARKVEANRISETTVFVIRGLNGEKSGPIKNGATVGIFTSDGKYRLDLDSPPLKTRMTNSWDSWATRLRIKNVQPIHPDNPVQPPKPVDPPKPEDPQDPGNEKPVDPASHQQLTTLERIFVGVYEGVKRAQVDVQRGASRKFDWFFPEVENGKRETRTIEVPIPQADGTTEIKKIPLFALVPHHDLMIDSVTVKMKVDLLNLTKSETNDEINEIESVLARAGDSPSLFADIEIHLKGTDPVEGVARLNDEIVKRF